MYMIPGQGKKPFQITWSRTKPFADPQSKEGVVLLYCERQVLMDEA